MQFVLMVSIQRLHSMNHDDFEFATALVQPLSDVLIWLQHFPVKSPVGCIHHQTIYAATAIRTYVESPVQRVNLAQAKKEH